MIYLKKQNVSIITPPHTASGNLHRALCPKFGTWMEGNGPVDDPNEPPKHHLAVPVEGSQVYYVCRNPLTRLVGLFLHYEWSQKNETQHGLKYMCWEEFVLNLNDLYWFFRVTLSQFIDAANLDDYKTIRYETLESDVSEIVGETVVLPDKYHRLINLQEWYDYHEDCCDILQIARDWGREDADRFGYDIDSQLW